MTLGKLAQEMIDRLADLTNHRDAMLTRWNAAADLGVWETPEPPASTDVATIVKGVGEFLQSILDANALPVLEAGPVATGTGPSILLQDPVAANRKRFDDMTQHEAVKALLSRRKVRTADDLRRQNRDPLTTFWHAGQTLRHLAELVDQRPDLQRELLFTLLAGAWKKPDFVVRRDAGGDEIEEIFPTAESWNDDWYQGTDAGRIVTDWEPHASSATDGS
jgi:hypothetical protein